MTTEKDDDSGSMRADWAQHAHTQTLGAALDKSTERAMKSLKAACMNTTDPKVMEAYVMWRETAIAAELFRTGVSR